MYVLGVFNEKLYLGFNLFVGLDIRANSTTGIFAELCTYLKIPYPAIKITPAQWRAFNRIMYVHHCPDNTKTVAPAFIEYIETVRPILETEKIWFDIFKDVTNRIAIKMLEVCLEKRPKRGRRYIHAIIGDE